jgi:hypothetical protein
MPSFSDFAGFEGFFVLQQTVRFAPVASAAPPGCCGLQALLWSLKDKPVREFCSADKLKDQS